jgi:predicted nuclease of predicted toxin-antitoxin system
MKLLFDQNLSPTLAARLVDLFPGSTHVRHVGMDRADDSDVCRFAVDGDFVIVTQDDDFPELAYLLEAAPKVIWLIAGNSTTIQRERILRSYHEQLEAFGLDPNRRLFIIR